MSEDLVRLRIADGPPPKELWAPSPAANRAARLRPQPATRSSRSGIAWRGARLEILCALAMIAIWAAFFLAVGEL